MSKRSITLFIIALALLLQFLLRAYHPLALAGYADESHHIRRAEVAWEFTEDPVASYQPGKLLLYYYLGLFETDRDQYLLISRLAVALISLLSGAAIYGIGKRLYSPQAGAIALWLYVTLPYTFFFDRLALADPLTLALLLVTLWVLLIWQRSTSLRWSGLAALLMILTPMAKLTAMGIVAVPPLLIFLNNRPNWRAYLRPVAGMYALFALVWIPMFTPAIIGEIRGGDNRVVLVGDYLLNIHEPEQNFIENLADNLWEVVYQSAFYLSWYGVALVGIALVWILYRRPKRALLLLGLLLITWLPTILLGSYPSTRYLQIGVPFLILMVAIGLQEIATLLTSSLHRQGIYWLLGFYALVWCLPFWTQTITKPHLLDIPPDDLWRYVQSGTAGYGYLEAVPYLQAEAKTEQRPVYVYGILGSCHLMRLYLPSPDPVTLTCAQLETGRQLSPQTIELIRSAAESHDQLYILLERELGSNFDDLPLQWEFERFFLRPREGVRLELWRVQATENSQGFPPLPQSLVGG